MPVVPLDRLPLPNLKAYSCVSVLALSACVYFATQIIKDPNWNNIPAEIDNRRNTAAANIQNNTESEGRRLSQYVSEVFLVMTREPICVWVSNCLIFYNTTDLFTRIG